MTPKEAADKLRPTFHLEQMAAEDRHHVLFVEQVAAELDIEPTAFNLHQVAEALDQAGIVGEMHQFPMMLYSRRHHAVEGVAASVYEPRHDCMHVSVANEEQANALGSDWVDSIAALPPRGEIPHAAPVPEPKAEKAEHADAID